MTSVAICSFPILTGLRSRLPEQRNTGWSCCRKTCRTTMSSSGLRKVLQTCCDGCSRSSGQRRYLMSTKHYLRGTISTDVLPWQNSVEGLKEGHQLFHTSMAALVEQQLEFGDEDREFGRICDITLCDWCRPCGPLAPVTALSSRICSGGPKIVGYVCFSVDLIHVSQWPYNPENVPLKDWVLIHFLQFLSNLDSVEIKSLLLGQRCQTALAVTPFLLTVGSIVVSAEGSTHMDMKKWACCLKLREFISGPEKNQQWVFLLDHFEVDV